MDISVIQGGLEMNSDKKLVKSSSQRMISGVCGGIAEYFNMDVTVIRILWVVFSFSGSGIIAYIIAALIMPEAE